MLKLRLIAWICSVTLMILGVGMAFPQDYPNRPMRIVVGGVGGASDFVARQIAQGISGPLGQPVVVDNRPSGVIPGETVAKAPPDGYTVLFASSLFWNLPLLQKTPYDPVKDFLPVSLTNRAPYVLAVHPSVPVKSVKELIALAKARPGELNYGTSGLGGVLHLGMELFKSMAGVNIMLVPYKGTGQAISGLISGEVELMILNPGEVATHAKSGKLRALAVTSPEPSAMTPGLPTMAASGLRGYELVSAQGVFVPAKTPAAITNRLNQEIVRLLNRADVKQRFFDVRLETVGSSPEEFAGTIRAEMIKWGKVIKDAGIRAE